MIQDKFKDHLESRLSFLRDVVAAHVKVTPFMTSIEAVALVAGAGISISYDDKVQLELSTNDLKGQAQRLMEALEKVTGYTFERTDDYASEWGASRTFKMVDLPVQVIVYLPMDAESGCRRVQVGVKEVPIYELKCDDQA